MIYLSFGHVEGLTDEEKALLTELTDAFNYHQSANVVKDKYYEGHIGVRDVNLGIAMPDRLQRLEVGCNWGQKAVDVLASRSMFDGFVGTSVSVDRLTQLIADADVQEIRIFCAKQVRGWLRSHLSNRQKQSQCRGCRCEQQSTSGKPSLQHHFESTGRKP